MSTLKWRRPQNIPYPKVWLRFSAFDLDAKTLVEYRIEDLAETKFNDALAFMTEHYLRDEPMAELFDALNDQDYIDTFQSIWKIILEQKMVLVCYKEGSDEIIGLNATYVQTKNENLFKKVQSKSKSFPIVLGCIDIMYKDFNVFDHYKTDKCLNAIGLIVLPEYRCRGIGEKIVEARKNLCEPMDIPVTSTLFTSDFSTHIARKIGFETNVAYRYDEISKINPDYCFQNIKSQCITIGTWKF